MTEKSEKKEFEFDPKKIPTDPGCYLYYGEKEDDLLYIGKAKNLRKRVTSYFQKDHEVARTQVMVSKIRRIETRVVNSEIEALVLENNLIKEHMPRYNVRLRDDKNFVYLRITKEEFPKMEIVRRLVKDGSTYIGPRTATKAFKNMVRFCQKQFRIRMVKESQNYYPHLQAGLLDEDADTYKTRVNAMKRFLNGNTAEVLKELQEKMMQFAAEKKFEAAGKVRDLIASVDVATQKQNVEFADRMDRDCVAFERVGSTAYFVRIVFRHGKLLHQNEVQVKAPQSQSDEAVLEQFLLQFYPKVVDEPKEILLPLQIDEQAGVETYLNTAFFIDRHVSFVVPQKGDKKQVLDMALQNAQFFAKRQQLEEINNSDNFAKALPELAESLNLLEPPKRMECYDISHFSGQDTVASMVVFVDGKPAKDQYKRFKIKSLEEGKIDDFASMNEVLSRRFKRSFQKPIEEKKGEIEMKEVETEEEWNEYHDMLETEIFNRYHPEIEYDRDHKDHTKKKHQPYVFMKDEKIIGAVRLDEKGKTAIILRLFAIKGGLQRQGLGTQCLQMIEGFCREEKKKKLLLNAQKSVIVFYGKNGYEPGVWKGDSSLDDSIPMGKVIEQKQERWPLPDLVVIDGGKGQLSAVMKLFKTDEFKALMEESDREFDPQTQIISLAKREEEIFRPGEKESILLGLESAPLQLLQRIRDEAHRFAISFNRSLRGKNQVKSVLDEIDGIGGVTKKKLLLEFGSVSGIRSASDEELEKIVNAKQLENLRHHL